MKILPLLFLLILGAMPLRAQEPVAFTTSDGVTVYGDYYAAADAARPVILAFHQAPTDGTAHPEAHLHAEFYPAYRMPGRLKYLAGSEIGARVARHVTGHYFRPRP